MAKKKYAPKDIPQLRENLETAKMNRDHLAAAVKQIEKSLEKAKANLHKATTEAVECHAVLKYGFGVKDVQL